MSHSQYYSNLKDRLLEEIPNRQHHLIPHEAELRPLATEWFDKGIDIEEGISMIMHAIMVKENESTAE